MRRLLAVALTAGFSLSLATGVIPAAADSTPPPMTGYACDPGQGVTVAVDFTDRADKYQIGCAKGGQASIAAALTAAGVRVPEMVSLVGFNNLATVKHLSPPLTTVNIPLDSIAEWALELLQKEGACAGQPVKLYVPTALKIRKSCASPRK